jgi:hypothetical protein
MLLTRGIKSPLALQASFLMRDDARNLIPCLPLYLNSNKKTTQKTGASYGAASSYVLDNSVPGRLRRSAVFTKLTQTQTQPKPKPKSHPSKLPQRRSLPEAEASRRARADLWSSPVVFNHNPNPTQTQTQTQIPSFPNAKASARTRWDSSCVFSVTKYYFCASFNRQRNEGEKK